jgi:hypothetical protein
VYALEKDANDFPSLVGSSSNRKAAVNANKLAKVVVDAACLSGERKGRASVKTVRVETADGHILVNDFI